MEFITLDEFIAQHAEFYRDLLKQAQDRSPFGNVCATCAYFHGVDIPRISWYSVGERGIGARSECRRRAAVYTATMGVRSWPRVYGSDWCGEYLQVVRLTKNT